MQVGKRFEAIKNTMSEPYVYDDYSRNLGNAMVEQAAKDLRSACKHDIKHREYNYGGQNYIMKTSSIMFFFSSPLCEIACGDIDPWYICSEIFNEMHYPYTEEAERDYERGCML